MKKKKTVVVLFILLMGFACKTTKNGTSRINKGMNAKTTVNKHNENAPKFNTLTSRIQVQYRDRRQSNSLSVSLRIKKDEIIWASASVLGFPVAKLLITPQRVSYYESIGRTYFDGNFSLLNDWLGVETNFEMVQNLLLGNALFPLNEDGYILNMTGENYQLKPKNEHRLFKHAIYLNEKFKVSRQQVFQKSDNRILTVHYPEYQESKNEIFPKTVRLEIREENDLTEIRLDYRNVETNTNVSYPFSIPKQYQEITFD